MQELSTQDLFLLSVIVGTQNTYLKLIRFYNNYLLEEFYFEPCKNSYFPNLKCIIMSNKT